MIIVPHSPPPPSREAVELGKKIAAAVRILQQENPAIRDRDVRRGLRLAEAELRPTTGRSMAGIYAVLGLLTTLLVGVIAMTFVTNRGSPPKSVTLALVAVAVGIVVLAVYAIVAARRR